VAEAQGQFGNPMEGEICDWKLLLEDIGEDSADREDLRLTMVNCRLCSSMNSYGYL
jgi:hypothetical protein